MVLFRYLSQQLLITTLGVVTVLMAVITTGRFIKYLSDAATGRMVVDILFAVMLYRIPGFLDVVLPLALFLAILLVYGRLYADSEMVVIHACGISPARVLLYTCGPALLVAAVLAAFTLVITPAGFARADALLNNPDNVSGAATLVPGRFQSTESGRKANYTESMSDDQKRMQRVFIAARERDDQGQVRQVITVATSGKLARDEQSGTRYLELHDGVRYEGWPGQQDFSVMTFAAFGQQLEPSEQPAKRNKISSESQPTLAIMGSDLPWDRAALHWRLSLPVSVLVAVFLALPLSRTSPRQGRWMKLVPALLVFLVYLVLLISVRDAMAVGRFSHGGVLWLVHAAVAAFGGSLMLFAYLRERRALLAMAGARQ